MCVLTVKQMLESCLSSLFLVNFSVLLEEAHTQRESSKLCHFFPADFIVFQNCCARGSDNTENSQQSALGKTGVTSQPKKSKWYHKSVQNCLGLNPFPFKTYDRFIEIGEIRVMGKKRKEAQLNYLLF